MTSLIRLNQTSLNPSQNQLRLKKNQRIQIYLHKLEPVLVRIQKKTIHNNKAKSKKSQRLSAEMMTCKKDIINWSNQAPQQSLAICFLEMKIITKIKRKKIVESNRSCQHSGRRSKTVYLCPQQEVSNSNILSNS